MASFSRNKLLSFVLTALCFFSGAYFLSSPAAIPASSALADASVADSSLSSSSVVLIDAGHGGIDPGKVGAAGTLEKDLNLSLALLLKTLLEAQDIHVILTRESDQDLGTDDSNRQLSDLKQRVRMIEDKKPDAVVSIHQNSYTDPSVYGAQCFYYTGSEEGNRLAESIHNRIVNHTKQTKIRPVKENKDYYLLKYSPFPTVIVECGFLSNPQEEQLLSSPSYQRKMAWAIHLGLLEYLNSHNKNQATDRSARPIA